MKDTIKDIINTLPEETRTRGMQLREDVSKHQWAIGDLCNEVYNHSQLNDISGHKIHSAVVVSLMIDGGYSPSTIMLYSQVAQFFPQNVRDKYDVLAFQLFIVAKSTQEDWELVLEQAMDFLAKHGRPPTAAMLRMLYNAPELEELEADLHNHEDEIGQPIKQFWEGLRGWKKELQSLFDGIDLSPKEKAALHYAMTDLERAIATIEGVLLEKV